MQATGPIVKNQKAYFKVILRNYRGTQVMIKLLYFKKLVEAAGHSQEELAFSSYIDSVGKLLGALVKSGEQYQQALGDGSNLQVTINKYFVELASPIREGYKIAFSPTAR